MRSQIGNPQPKLHPEPISSLNPAHFWLHPSFAVLRVAPLAPQAHQQQMQQLLRSSCQMLTHHMKPLHHPNGLQQPLRTLQQAGALVVAPRATLTSSGCKGGCRAAAVVQHASTTSSKWQPLLSQQSSAQQQQLWRGAVGSSSRQQCGVSARRQQHVCFASSSQPADSSAPQPSGSGGSNTVSHKHSRLERL